MRRIANYSTKQQELKKNVELSLSENESIVSSTLKNSIFGKNSRNIHDLF